MKRLIKTAALLSALSLAACAGTDGTTQAEGGAGMLNTTCPVSGKELAADAPTRSHGEGSVGFCCNNCAGKWDGMSDEDKAKAMQ